MKWCFGLLGIAWLAGCARFQPEPLSPAQSAEALENRSLTNAALRTFLETNLHRPFPDWPEASWDFDMLTLAAFYYHPDLAVARADWNAAQAAIQTAGGRPNPTLSLVPGYNTTHSGLPSPWFPAVSFDVPIETAGKRGHRIAAANQLSESARLNLATAAWKVRGNLRSALLADAAARQRTRLLSDQVALQEKIVALLGQQARAGALASQDLAAPHIALARARLELADAQSQQAETRVNLAAAIGLPLRALAEAPLSFDPLKDWTGSADLTSAEVRRAALQSRADVLGALADYAAAQATLQLEIARQYPDVHISPGYQFDQGDNKWSLGITFELPVLNQNQGPIAEARARREQAAARFTAVQARVLAEIERSVETYRVSRKNLVTLDTLAEAQTRRRESVEAQFKAGATDSLDLLNARLELVNGELARGEGLVKLQQSFAALEDAVQRPLPGDWSTAALAGDRPQTPAPAPTHKESN
jgi:outer membrane protein, heavy metal efflux system